MVDLSHSLQFSHRYEYADAVGIGVPVVLTLGSRTADLTAHIDTGASHCVMQRAVAEDRLGIIVEHGNRLTFTTANSSFQAFGHDVLINVLGVEFETMVYFFADPEIRKNVLGRHGWLNRVRLGIVDYDQTLYLSTYNSLT
jgi:hypothetical protein